MIPLPRDERIRSAILEKYFVRDEWEEEYEETTGETKAIIDYSELSYQEVLDLPMSLYLILKKDAWLNTLKSSNQGREFLKTLYTLQQTEPDYDAIKRFNERRRK